MRSAKQSNNSLVCRLALYETAIDAARFTTLTFDVAGFGHAVASGVIASGVGYSICGTTVASMASVGRSLRAPSNSIQELSP